MPWDRVIQDSDDEEDPLAADFLPLAKPRERQPPPDNENPASNGPVDDESTSANNQIAVNFDDFLQSQDAAHARLTSSQQRREERWIPANGEGGSLGTVMNEIGIAQQRLYDEEEAHHADQHVSRMSPELPHVEPQPFADAHNAFQDPNTPYYMNHAAPEIPTIPYHHPDASCPPTVPYTNGPNTEYPEAQGHTYPQALGGHTQPSSNLSSHNYPNSAAPSYNLFESSLHPSTTPHDQNNQFPFPLERIQTSPRRCDSAWELISSPHDTEPNSSIVRARSDHAGLGDLQQSIPAGNMLEVSFQAPVCVEIPSAPAAEKKRGRKKKQSLPDADEDDELAQPATTTPAIQGQPEKRKPGRPPKNAKKGTEEAEGSNVESSHQSDMPAEYPNGAVAPTGGPEQPRDSIPSEPTKSTREPKKKKIKRGKTTSLMLKKTCESDVEDDVIWVDDKPANIVADEPNAQCGVVTEPDNNAAEAEAKQDSESTPAPKKRGRKRKKTSELPTEEQTAEIAAEPEAPEIQESMAKTVTDEPTTDNAEPISVSPRATSPCEPESNAQNPLPVTPKKSEPQTPDPSSASNKGPTKHSPISTTSKVPYRVGLSRRARIAPLLKIVRR
ncbi:hypothetical protein BDV59DRAFT_166261 [Aspergillus ambiguus]|uniref:uncharacterized protein n=1 Tax=Aspergillus ambiguus TaxID=176160 RepID=UPI003CCDC569